MKEGQVVCALKKWKRMTSSEEEKERGMQEAKAGGNGVKGEEWKRMNFVREGKNEDKKWEMRKVKKTEDGKGMEEKEFCLEAKERRLKITGIEESKGSEEKTRMKKERKRENDN